MALGNGKGNEQMVEFWKSELVDILGKAGDNDTEMHAILAEFDLPYRFEDDVLRAAEHIPGEITQEEISEPWVTTSATPHSDGSGQDRSPAGQQLQLL